MTETTPRVLVWASRAAALGAVVMVGWVFWTAGDAVLHGHPLYLGLVLLTSVAAIVALLVSDKKQPRHTRRRLVLRALGIAGAVVWVPLLAWLRPFPATAVALDALRSDGAVTVSESPTRIVMEPASDASTTGVLFYPGARVDARAYAAHLRPLAEAGYPVIIVKEPLGIAFFATDGFEHTRNATPTVYTWVVGGHSLGGTVAAKAADKDYLAGAMGPIGLLLYASYPANDMSTYDGAVASISGSLDGLATPADIEASAGDLPADTAFTQVLGGVHAQFGAYGAQPGDGIATISDEDARRQIVDASLALLEQVD